MLTMLTDKRANGRRMIYLVLEPQDIDHIKQGNPVAADTSRVEGHDILICFAPDGERFKNMVQSEFPNVSIQTFAQLLKTIQQYPDVHRPMKTASSPEARQDVGKVKQ